MPHGFTSNDDVIFEREFLTGFPIELEDYFYAVPPGTTGKIIDTQEDSVLVQINNPAHREKKSNLRLYTADSPRSKRGGVACIAKWKPGQGTTPSFAWPSTAGVPVTAAHHAERAKVPPPKEE